MPDLITRCPECATAFRISDTLLKSAKGMVRCGSCLKVFNAQQNLESKSQSPQVKKASPLSTERSEGSAALIQSNPISITGFLKQQDPGEQKTPEHEDEQNESYADSELDQPSRSTDTRSLFERKPDDHDVNALDEELDPDDDESWALELLKDDSDLNVQFKKITEAPKPPDTTLPELDDYIENLMASPSESEISTTPNDTTAPINKVTIGEAKYSNVDKTERAHAKEDYPQQPGSEAADFTSSTNSPFVPDTTHRRERAATNNEQTNEQDHALTHARTTKPKIQTKKNAPATTNAKLQDAIAAIEPEPLEVDWAPSRSWKKRVLWPLLTLTALILLLAQVAWLEFHRLNRIEPYRSFYAFVCPHVNCTLPDLVDHSKIQTSNLVVRTHPEVEKALMVDVILQNNAVFEQAFPKLQLTFSNLRNEPVASRLLTPDDYLGGELAGSKRMPVKQPIHIGLEVVDPGEEAVSYSIAIVD